MGRYVEQESDFVLPGRNIGADACLVVYCIVPNCTTHQSHEYLPIRPRGEVRPGYGSEYHSTVLYCTSTVKCSRDEREQDGRLRLAPMEKNEGSFTSIEDKVDLGTEEGQS